MLTSNIKSIFETVIIFGQANLFTECSVVLVSFRLCTVFAVNIK